MAAIDTFAGFTTPLNAPASSVDVITPSDTADIAHITRNVYVGGAGDLTVVMKNGATVTFKAVPVGSVLPIRISRVNATGTTATNLLGLY